MKCLVRAMTWCGVWLAGSWLSMGLLAAQEPGRAKEDAPAKPVAEAEKEKAPAKTEPGATGEAAKPAAAKEECKPQTKAEKLKQAKDVFAGVVDSAELDVSPGQVEKAVEAYYKDMKINNGYMNKNGQKYIIVEGHAGFVGDLKKPGWVTNRVAALGEAELKARTALAKSIKQSITSGQFFETFDSLSPDMVKEVKELQTAAPSASLYDEATSVFAAAQVMGAVTLKTIEGEDPEGGYEVVTIMAWSPKLRDLAINALADCDYCLPREELSSVEEIPQAAEELVKFHGCRVWLNKEGRRYYVAFAESEPLVRSRAGRSNAIGRAKDKAAVDATGMLARALAADVTSADISQTSRLLEEFSGDKTEEKLTQAFYQRAQSVTKIDLSGALTVRKWVTNHPQWKVAVAGAVVVWSPETKDLVRELGLQNRLDPADGAKLAAYLAGKYPKSAEGIGTKTSGKTDRAKPNPRDRKQGFQESPNTPLP